MIIKRVQLLNFRNFEGLHSFFFDKLNLIVGKNGAGKSSLSRIAITFVLFGDSEVSLSSLPTKGVGEGWASLLIEDKGDEIYIQREVPTKLHVTLNGQEVLPESTNVEKQKWIEARFNDLHYFRKFRMIDLRLGLNLLEEGKTALRKTIINLNEGFLNNVKDRLQKKKTLYDKFNKDTAVVFSHYPSAKRVALLESKSKEIANDKNEIQKEISDLEKDFHNISNQLGFKTNVYREATAKVSRLKSEKNQCPTCKQVIPRDFYEGLIAECEKTIDIATKECSVLNEEGLSQRSAIEHSKEIYKKYFEKLDKINKLRLKLETRLKQKDYKYSTKDVLLVSNAIKELDKFYSFYIVQTVQNLEPIINDIIAKANFELKFRLDTKGDFDIVLLRDGAEFSYKDLSNGQRLLLTIAFQIALLLEKGDSGLIVADEGFSSLDNETILLVFELFRDLPLQLISIIHRFEEPVENVNIINLGESNVRKTDESISAKA